MKTIERKFLLCTFSVMLTLNLACGDDPVLDTELDSSYSTLDEAARETDPMLESDLTSMSLAEKERLLTVLIRKNKKEARETKILQEINQGLCQKFTEVKKQCSALAPLMLTTYDNLKCSKEELKNEITVKVNGQYQLIADSLYESNNLSGESTVTFSSKTGAKDLDVRFIDITKLVLVSKGASHGSPEATGFTLSVNGIKLFGPEDLEKESGSNFKVKLSKFLDITKSSDCNIPRAELDQIRNEKRNKFGEPL